MPEIHFSNRLLGNIKNRGQRTIVSNIREYCSLTPIVSIVLITVLDFMI